MPESKRIFGNRLVELLARWSALLRQQRFIASESSQPVAGRSFARGDTQVGKQVAHCPASPYRKTGCGSRSLKEMQMRVDEARCDRAACQLDEMGAGTDERL